ncbi:putative solute/hydrogen antiporter [Gordonia hirsuta DSM 44140 = NBRC 16056]|uniref:Putative solute/hydrogen antiporter n=1 Tax=Gordonia hirsuta DSM 44140 = NBRC 16056 TaxID=1121927 RepID=L7L960_9ACTN|nr:cation:proton antiporter family protein [Gordonia hirsuta]GAC57296.1 putative solute/hydrogen antiporter [Gordonia hirsuta DSM 44140 = NBRC 16056]
MTLLATYLAAVFACGLVAKLLRLPPLIGFLAAGFILNAAGVDRIGGLTEVAEVGVMLLLFAIGLQLDIRSLIKKEVWLNAGLHMLVMTVIGVGFLTLLAVIGLIGPKSLQVLVAIAFVLSFSSTIVAIKVLQERGDEQALYGRIVIGILVMQDLGAVVLMSISRGEAPSIWALSLVAVIPLVSLLTKHWYRIGHGEMEVLFGIGMAMIPGYLLFSAVGLSGSLGAMIIGVVLARRPGAAQLANALFRIKDLLLVGFFVGIGFHGIPEWENVAVGLSLLLLLPLQGVVYWGLLWLFGLRNRTSLLSALALANYSEFALIIAEMGTEDGWLSESWLLTLVIAVSGGFVLAGVANPTSVSAVSRFARRLPVRPPHKIHPDDRPIETGYAQALVLGMGRVGYAVYRQLVDEYGYRTLGVEHDPNRTHELASKGVDIIEGDATDYDFWTRVVDTGSVKLIVLAMPAQYANIEAVRELQRVGDGGAVIASVALYREDVHELKDLGVDVVIHLYQGAGEALADRAVDAVATGKIPPRTGAKPFDWRGVGTREMRVQDDSRTSES